MSFDLSLRRAALAALLGFASTGLAGEPGSGSSSATRDAVRFSELDFREMASRVVSPDYPIDAIRSGITGIAVADVHVAANGQVSAINILVAPSGSISRAMKEAVSQWHFNIVSGRPGTAAAPRTALSRSGKVTYYFVRQGSQWKVLSPQESFYVGPSFAH